MTEITYRSYQPGDAEDIKQILNEAFYIHRYVSGDTLLDSALEIYLRECLLGSTWTRVAVKDGHVVGVIMGRVARQPRLAGRIKNRLLSWGHMARALLLGVTQWSSMRQYFAFDRVYAQLRKKTSHPLTDELTLFAVSATTRGHTAERRLPLQSSAGAAGRGAWLARVLGASTSEVGGSPLITVTPSRLRWGCWTGGS
ncbi:MAG: hypothetical protein ACTH8V_00080 [Brachybacterium tyrofermentans]